MWSTHTRRKKFETLPESLNLTNQLHKQKHRQKILIKFIRIVKLIDNYEIECD